MLVPFAEPIYVTRPFLPPLADYAAGLEEIWRNVRLTNDGPILRRFESKLARSLGTENLALFTNGTLALHLALRGLGIRGEVITTPFTFAATTHALVWNGNQPVFADIEPTTYTLDPSAVEAAITPRTGAILAVHVYGYPCRLEALADLARRYRLPLIYDAAHAFGVSVEGRPIGQFGDLSMFSFHATKPFHSIEGGLLVFGDGKQRRTFDLLRNFGLANETDVLLPGTNAKMNEFQALMGLQLLDHLDGIRERRRQIDALYRDQLGNLPGLRIPPAPSVHVTSNYSYFPVEIEPTEFGASRDQLCEFLKGYNVFARRYFYPLVPDFACYRDQFGAVPLPNARRVASQILTLPIYDSLALEDVARICAVIRSLERLDRSKRV
ncbi:MAG: DegT/DnrJ/EryC1/StrS family aminotransferase [Verrucomicrobia bacterium]|nr:DegT/DnrJ/EryC1/StrS family aminotransferase [Verrucomicrobiota bacterium]